MTLRKDTELPAARHTGGWIVLGGALLVACISFAAPPSQTDSHLPHSTIQLGIDINTAGAAELACIPGVGPSLADRIIEYRQLHGPFKQTADIQQVPGVGPKLAEHIIQAIAPLETSPQRG